jgi:glycosyltransferase involved in cell wall biosynthesis
MPKNKIKIVFNIMVKNEAKVIIPMLETVYKYIDYWVIQDNGSTDGTQQLITSFFKEKNIPGFLYYTPWVSHGHNRNDATQTCLKSDHGCDYILRVDADERLEVDDDFDWDQLFNCDEWYVHSKTSFGDTSVYRPWILNAKIDWEFVPSRAHELIRRKSREKWKLGYLSKNLRIIMVEGSHSSTNPLKFYVDAKELEHQLILTPIKDRNDPDFSYDAYYVWYLAKSYYDFLENYRSSDHKFANMKMMFGDDHIKEIARRSIFYYRKYLELTMGIRDDTNLSIMYESIPTTLGYTNEMAYVAFCYMGELILRCYDDKKDGIQYLINSYRIDHTRNEGLLCLCRYYVEKQDHKMTYLYSLLSIQNNHVDVEKQREFFLNKCAYPDTNYEPLYYHYTSAMYLKKYDESKKSCRRLLDSVDLIPANMLDQINSDYNKLCELTVK